MQGSQLFFVATAVVCVGLVSAHTPKPDTALPFPTSQGAEKFDSFVRNCRSFAAGNMAVLVSPSTYFSQMPTEWLNAKDIIVSECSDDHKSYVASTDPAEIQEFYGDICPLSGPSYGLNVSYLPFPESQGADHFHAFVQNCYNLAKGRTANLESPSTYFSKMPDEWINSTNATIASIAKEFTSLFSGTKTGNNTDFYIRMCPMLAPAPSSNLQAPDAGPSTASVSTSSGTTTTSSMSTSTLLSSSSIVSTSLPTASSNGTMSTTWNFVTTSTTSNSIPTTTFTTTLIAPTTSVSQIVSTSITASSTWTESHTTSTTTDIPSPYATLPMQPQLSGAGLYVMTSPFLLIGCIFLAFL